MYNVCAKCTSGYVYNVYQAYATKCTLVYNVYAGVRVDKVYIRVYQVYIGVYQVYVTVQCVR